MSRKSPDCAEMLPRRRQSAGFSLIELMMVIAIIAVLAGLVLPSSNPTLNDQLRAAAQILKTDLAYARSLAVTYNSTYRVSFDTDGNRYVLEHSGSNPALDTLPDSPFRDSGDPTDQHIVDLDELPRIGAAVRLAAVAETGESLTQVSDVEFGPLGETTRSTPTIVWLAAGRGPDTRYVVLSVNPVTGLAELARYTTEGPPPGILAAHTNS